MKLQKLFACVCVVALFYGNTFSAALAAVTPNSFIAPQAIATVITAAGSTIFTAGSNGAICNSLVVSTTSTNNISISVGFSSTEIFVAQLIPLGAGTVNNSGSGTFAGTPAVDMLAPAIWPGLAPDSNGKPSLLLPSGGTLYVGTSGGSSGSTTTAYAACANF